LAISRAGRFILGMRTGEVKERFCNKFFTTAGNTG
jgi:hypothetical protein